MQSNDEPILPPAAIVIFGITGDLAQRKLLPALYYLIKSNVLHEHTTIIGITRRDVTAHEVLDEKKLCSRDPEGTCDAKAVAKMRGMLHMHKMDLLDGAAYDKLRDYLNDVEKKAGQPMRRLFYLSIPPTVFEPIVKLLGEHGLNTPPEAAEGTANLLIEKPFGYDLASAKELIAQVGEHFSEEQVFRIDHYLAKETVQNILTFRFGNPMFEPLWNAQHIERIEVEATEKIGIEGRAIFYEQTGALRDFVQSHLLQLVAVTTMEHPGNMSSASIHKAKLALLDSIEPISPMEIPTHTVRGQYKGYREEVQSPKTATETFAALQLSIDSDRWRGVPVIVKTGKALREKCTRVRVLFRTGKGEEQNCMTFDIQPREGVEIALQVKKPGFTNATEASSMEFNYERSFGNADFPDAYERVLVDAIRGDHTLFATDDEVLASWRILEQIIEAWTQNDDNLHFYEQGSDGPKLPAAFDE
ncbi:MAG TPA: glucose-6-phosphate dehydrogenase [Candidatus Saccharimonadales bacterium]